MGRGEAPLVSVFLRLHKRWSCCSRSPSSALLPTFFGEGSLTKRDHRKKKRYPYSNLSTGPSLYLRFDSKMSSSRLVHLGGRWGNSLHFKADDSRMSHVTCLGFPLKPPEMSAWPWPSGGVLRQRRGVLPRALARPHRGPCAARRHAERLRHL